MRKRIAQMLARARQIIDQRHATARSGVRVIDAPTYEEFDRECERIMAEEPGSYLFVPEQEDFFVFVLRTTGRTVEEHEAEWRQAREEQTGPGDSGPTE